MTDLATFINKLLCILAVLPGMLGTLATIQGSILIAKARAMHDDYGQARAVGYVAIGVSLLILCAVLGAPALAKWLVGIILG